MSQVDSNTTFGTTVAGPAAGAVICGPVTPPAGTYTVTVKAYMSGTTTAVDRGNVQLTKNAAQLAIIGVPGQVASNSYDCYTQQCRTTFNGTDTISLTVIGAASVTAVYSGIMILDKTGN